MTAFFVWIFLITVALTVYGIILWRRAKGRFRFQARLTILFILFALVPTVPLTLSLSLLLTKSTELFMLPEIEDSLSESLQFMRHQLAARAQRFMERYPDISQLDVDILKNENICYAGHLSLPSDSVVLEQFIPVSDDVKSPIGRTWPENLARLPIGQYLDYLAEFPGKEYFELFQKNPIGPVRFIGIELTDEFISTRTKVTSTLRNYSSLSLLRETFISQGLVWAIAVFFVALLTIIAIVIGKNFSRGISSPIRTLTEGMKKVGQGDLSHRVQCKAKDEIDFLITSFNRMTEDLQKSQINLQKAERAAAWRDVARQISHEIKNPLTPMQLSLHRISKKLTEKRVQEKEVDQALAIIEDEIESMRRMADEFSEFARLPHPEPRPTNLVEIIQNSVKLFESEMHKVSIHVKAEPGIDTVRIDKEQFRRVIHNLLKNAMEASSKGDRVQVKIGRSENPAFKAHLQIIDYGIGMDPETQSKIFMPYFTTKINGSGLGLYIVKQIIEDHGGAITLESTPSAGTTVHIYL